MALCFSAGLLAVGVLAFDRRYSVASRPGDFETDVPEHLTKGRRAGAKNFLPPDVFIATVEIWIWKG